MLDLNNFEIRISKFETISKFEIQMFKTLRFWKFKFVSDFVLRYSNFGG